MVKVKEDLTGKTFGRWVVIKQAEDIINPSGKRKAAWLCECNCKEHTQKVVLGTYLKAGTSLSCGCTKKKGDEVNDYDLSGEFGIGWTINTHKEFYFDLEDYDLINDYRWYEDTANGKYHTLRAYDRNNKKENLYASFIRM